MRRYCIVFLRNSGWDVQRPARRPAEMNIRKGAYDIAIQFLIKRHHSVTLPDHFLSSLALGPLKLERPFVLITDFLLPGDVITKSNDQRVYPIHYKNLARLEELAPTKKQFKTWERERGRPAGSARGSAARTSKAEQASC
jgi:hypothetical protein